MPEPPRSRPTLRGSPPSSATTAQEPALDGGETPLASADDDGELCADGESGGKGSSSSSDEVEFDFDDQPTLLPTYQPTPLPTY